MIRRCLYYSQLTSRGDLVRIPDIAKVGREYCQNNQISGLLIFDGVFFCEYLEGPVEPMTALMDHISQDSRHTKQVFLLDVTEPAQRRFKQWGLAYVLDEDMDSLSTFEGMSESEAMAHFMSLLPRLDVA